jgi:hypothetical protein
MNSGRVLGMVTPGQIGHDEGPNTRTLHNERGRVKEAFGQILLTNLIEMPLAESS